MKCVFIGLAGIYVAVVLSCISGVPVVKRSADFSCDGKENGNYPNPFDCGEYFTCSNGIKYIRDCPTGLHFNSKTGRCDWPRNVKCGPLDGFCKGKAPGDYSHPSNCTLYISCIGGDAQPIVRPCPAGLHFNETANQCQYPEDAGCLSSTVSPVTV